MFCGFLPLDLLFGFCSCVRFMRCWFIVVSCMLCLICQWSPNIVCILYVDYTLLLWECCVGGVWVCVLWLKSQTGNTLMIKMALGTAPHNVYWAPRPQWLKCFKNIGHICVGPHGWRNFLGYTFCSQTRCNGNTLLSVLSSSQVKMTVSTISAVQIHSGLLRKDQVAYLPLGLCSSWSPSCTKETARVDPTSWKAACFQTQPACSAPCEPFTITQSPVAHTPHSL